MAELFFPRVESPVYQDAWIVAVAEGLAGYEVEVYVNGQFYGRGRLDLVGRGAVYLIQPLKVNDQIFAMQVGGDLNNKVRKVVTVEAVPPDMLEKPNKEKFAPPVVATPLYECQRGFWVNKVVEGVQITCDVLSSSGSLKSSTETDTPWPGGWFGAPASGFEPGQQVRAKQAFRAPSKFPGASAYSTPPEPVQPAPDVKNEIYQCKVQESVSIGSKVLEVCKTLPGAMVRIYAEEMDPVTKTTKKVEYGERVSAGGCRPFELDHPLTHKNPKAVQRLCDGAESLPSKDVTIKQVIGTPEIETPICPGSTEVTVLHTEVGATIEVQVKPKGQASFTVLRRVTAGGPVTPVNLGQTLQSGDEVQARQSNDGQKPANGWTPTPGVSVGATPTPLTTEVRNDDNPNVMVFYLGQTVKFRAIDCQGAAEKVKRVVHVIHQPTGKQPNEVVAIPLEETKTGYFEAAWPIPLQVSAVPVGRYKARFEIAGQQQEKPFSVIGLTVSDTQAILAVHNKARAAVSALYPGVSVPPPLTWSHALAEEAQDWANQIVTVLHDSIHDTNRPYGRGENIAWSPSIGAFSPAQLVEMVWITGERDWFIPPCAAWGNACSTADPSDPQKWKPNWKAPTDAIGHYTQVLWGKTEEVGCGFAQDLTPSIPTTNREYLVGRYNPGGNWPGQPVFGL